MDCTALQETEQGPLNTPRLTAAQARRLCDRIVHEANNLRKLLVQLRDGKGWLTLGYSTWAELCEQEFGYSKRYANYLIQAEKVNQQVGTIVPALTESQARELGKVPAEDREKVLDWAAEKADGAPLTAKAIRAAAAEVAEGEPEEDVDVDGGDVDVGGDVGGDDVGGLRVVRAEEPPEAVSRRFRALIECDIDQWRRHNPAVSANLLAIVLRAIAADLEKVNAQAGEEGAR
jgi:hypothetical protein